MPITLALEKNQVSAVKCKAVSDSRVKVLEGGSCVIATSQDRSKRVSKWWRVNSVLCSRGVITLSASASSVLVSS